MKFPNRTTVLQVSNVFQKKFFLLGRGLYFLVFECSQCISIKFPDSSASFQCIPEEVFSFGKGLCFLEQLMLEK